MSKYQPVSMPIAQWNELMSHHPLAMADGVTPGCVECPDGCDGDGFVRWFDGHKLGVVPTFRIYECCDCGSTWQHEDVYADAWFPETP